METTFHRIFHRSHFYYSVWADISNDIKSYRMQNVHTM